MTVLILISTSTCSALSLHTQLTHRASLESRPAHRSGRMSCRAHRWPLSANRNQSTLTLIPRHFTDDQPNITLTISQFILSEYYKRGPGLTFLSRLHCFQNDVTVAPGRNKPGCTAVCFWTRAVELAVSEVHDRAGQSSEHACTKLSEGL